MSVNYTNYLRAGYPMLWVQTHEEDRAIETIAAEARQVGYKIYSWDIVSGFKDHSAGQSKPMAIPVKPIQMLATLQDSSIVFLKDFHKFIASVEIFRTIKNIIPVLKSRDSHLIIISPVMDIPIELEKDICALQFALPTVGEIMVIAERIVKDNNLAIEVDEYTMTASKGLTLHEAENALALSIIQESKYSRKVLEEEKLQAVKKSGLMEIYEPVPESELGGLELLKKYYHNRKRGFQDPRLPFPHGIILWGLPGAGKSLSAKVAASILNYPLLKLDVASLKGSLVGQSEERIRQVTALIDAIAPCVVFLDEMEKAMSGVQSSARTDGGTSAAMFGHFLTWMQESQVPKYIVGTVNDIDEILSLSQGALLRRFDDIFFLDLPSVVEREDILGIMNKRYNAGVSPKWVPQMDGWTGAEIEKFVVSAIYDSEEEAFANIHPVSHQNRDKIEKVREWARANARLANGEWQHEETISRRVRV